MVDGFIPTHAISVQIPLRQVALDTTLCDKVCH